MNIENLNITLYKLENALNNYYQDLCVEHDIEVLFLGSQSILFYHQNITSEAVVSSYEIDIIVLMGAQYKEEIKKITGFLDHAYGYESSFHNEQDFYIDNMTDLEDNENNTKKFPLDWRERAFLMTADSNTKIKFVCLNKHDVAVLKLIANREKDREYVQALIQGSLLDKKNLLQCLKETSHYTTAQQRQVISEKINHYYSLPQINILDNKKVKAHCKQ